MECPLQGQKNISHKKHRNLDFQVKRLSFGERRGPTEVKKYLYICRAEVTPAAEVVTSATFFAEVIISM